MLILEFLPSWVFYLLLLLGIVALVLSNSVLKLLPYNSVVKLAGIFVVGISIFMLGANHNNNVWLARIKDLEVKVAEAEAKSARTNTQIVQKTHTKTQTIRERGQDVIQYVDREVVKYDTTCVIPKEFVAAHNLAAEQPK